jgi:hypothetical protein
VFSSYGDDTNHNCTTLCLGSRLFLNVDFFQHTQIICEILSHWSVASNRNMTDAVSRVICVCWKNYIEENLDPGTNAVRWISSNTLSILWSLAFVNSVQAAHYLFMLSGHWQYNLNLVVCLPTRFKIPEKFQSKFRFRAIFHEFGSPGHQNHFSTFRFSPVFFKVTYSQRGCFTPPHHHHHCEPCLGLSERAYESFLAFVTLGINATNKVELNQLQIEPKTRVFFVGTSNFAGTPSNFR